MPDKFEEDFRSLIRSAGVAGVVGERVTWGEIPPQRPCVAVWNTTRDHDYHMGGPSGLKQAFVQIDCQAVHYADANNLARLIVSAIDAHNGTIADTDIQGVFIRGRRDSDEPSTGAPAQRYARCSLDVEVWYAATTDADS
jgi:hypothetical protein